MMKTLLILVASVLLSAQAWADRVIVWNKDPVSVVLPVGKEMRFTFPTDVSIQIPEAVASKLDSLAPNEQIVYWSAKEAFERARVIITSRDGDSVYLLDVSASSSAPTENLTLEDPARVIAGQSASESIALAAPTQELNDPVELVLTRFVAQSLYAPRRLMPTNADIMVYEGASMPTNFPLLRSQRGESYHVEVVGSWSGYGRFISAVLVINQGDVGVNVNPGLVQGNFTHITPQHLYLGPKGSAEDRTTLYLISDEPLMAALQGDGYGY